MIRRNHLQTVTRIDRLQLRQRERQSVSSQKNHNYLFKRTPDIIIDQNFRATSSNKKYHQYKDWKEHHRNKPEIQESKPNRKSIQPLLETNANQHPRTDYIKRDYQKQLHNMLNKQYTQDNHQLPKRRASSSASPAPFNYLRSQLTQNTQSEIQSLENTFNNTRLKGVPSNSESKPHYQYSAHRNSSFHPIQYEGNFLKDKITTSNDYSPQFEWKLLKTQNHGCYSSSTRGSSHNNVNHDEIESKLKTGYNEERIRYRDTDYLQKVDRSVRRDKRQQSTQRMLLQVGESSKGDQKVAQKLRLISSFNDQINDRIKNIISCFEQLRTKL